MKIAVIGAGLAGCEAAFAAASYGIDVDLYEMKPNEKSPAHKSDCFAELVCSNSLKASRIDSAAGLLKYEMSRLGSVCIEVAANCAVPAGGALAVDRDLFSENITEKIKSNNNINVVSRKMNSLPSNVDGVIIATGPLTEGDLSEEIKAICGSEYLNFFDAAAPIIAADTIDMSKAFIASRYDKGDTDGDYINCPLNKEQYLQFHAQLIAAQSAPLASFDKPVSVYEGCMPIEILAGRGEDSIRFGPMKPVGLRDPNTGHRPWAVVQLRKENSGGTMYNMVGFQTNLKFAEQKRVFSMIPALKDAEFLRYGVMHRNSFINSPALLDASYSLRYNRNIAIAGQLSGVEGYMESAQSGLVAAIHMSRRLLSLPEFDFPNYTMIGALSKYISDETVKNFQPMGANFGVLPSLELIIRDKRERYMAFANRSIEWFNQKFNGVLT